MTKLKLALSSMVVVFAVGTAVAASFIPKPAYTNINLDPAPNQEGLDCRPQGECDGSTGLCKITFEVSPGVFQDFQLYEKPATVCTIPLQGELQ